MNKYFVRTIEIQPVVTIEESELIDALTLNNKFENSFPIDNDYPERVKLEAYIVDSYEECQNFISEINIKIRHLFTIESLPN